MQNRPGDRVLLLLRSKTVTGIILMALGVTLLHLGLPENLIDLAALTIAALAIQPAGTTPTRRTAARKPHRKNRNRTTKRRTPRNK
ncbi:hypothetical protein [Streptomyces arboris]|uniref:Uncharacterized protein n=1 Tax=Streptomyces arboris TaxID=2600619 RepID=A0A5N5EDA3_9ACTN|nr:hypothetical protein [Streptomyces arboris]KAB2587531.1 hypothetical protein F5983_37480 [Streptomyces arboris]